VAGRRVPTAGGSPRVRSANRKDRLGLETRAFQDWGEFGDDPAGLNNGLALGGVADRLQARSRDCRRAATTASRSRSRLCAGSSAIRSVGHGGRNPPGTADAGKSAGRSRQAVRHEAARRSFAPSRQENPPQSRSGGGERHEPPRQDIPLPCPCGSAQWLKS
jgi:hypothetical protein